MFTCIRMNIACIEGHPKYSMHSTNKALVGPVCFICLVILGRKAWVKQARKNRTLHVPLIYGGTCIRIAGTSYIWRYLQFPFFWFWAGLNLQMHHPRRNNQCQNTSMCNWFASTFQHVNTCMVMYRSAHVRACVWACVGIELMQTDMHIAFDCRAHWFDHAIVSSTIGNVNMNIHQHEHVHGHWHVHEHRHAH